MIKSEHSTMRCGILIIGSLLWDDGEKGIRAAWRKTRLDAGAQVPVQAPIYYGRKSSTRSNTYTMVFGSGGQTGNAVLVPCVAEIETIDGLTTEADALWQAEAPAAAKPGTLSSSWGCVGSLFGRDKAHAKLAADWTAHFQKMKAQCVSVVNANGLLDIGWPNMLDGRPADFDIILATATDPEAEPPTAHAIADAWLAQNTGNENYFFNNVKHGIRTADDMAIWRRIEEHSPRWIGTEAYKPAIEILREEAKARNSR